MQVAIRNYEDCAPLAARMRPRSLMNTLVRTIYSVKENFYAEPSKQIASHRLFFILQFIGKTSLAKVISNHSKSRFLNLVALKAMLLK